MNEKDLEEKSSTQIILEAVHDLHDQEQVVTRETLAAILPQLTIGKIDDRLSYLIDTNQISRVQRGVYVPVFKHPPSREMCKYILNDGTVKIEIGTQVITLTPKEARSLGNLMVAEAMQFSNIEMGHNMALIQQEVIGEVRNIKREVKKLAQIEKQGNLSL
ncbi:hypothetical protein [Acinetobacter entericus]|uniref:Transcriptional regulator n=1 Tax=Acinetobacter entericus TaxID=2989714 RepID=A0ABT3NEE1_9GAMM|nr:hypothetical protein [Acinetobacter entericus]MCW8037931.1 hypothetical protein [Acinetobacter entericus]